MLESARRGSGRLIGSRGIGVLAGAVFVIAAAAFTHTANAAPAPSPTGSISPHSGTTATVIHVSAQCPAGDTRVFYGFSGGPPAWSDVGVPAADGSFTGSYSVGAAAVAFPRAGLGTTTQTLDFSIACDDGPDATIGQFTVNATSATTSPSPTPTATTSPATTSPATSTTTATRTATPSASATGTSGTPGSTGAASVAANAVRRGGSISVSGSGFQAGEQVRADLHSAPYRLGTVRADAAGRVRLNVQIPTGVTTGSHTITLTGLASGRVDLAHVTIRAALASSTPAPASPSGAGALASTGSAAEGDLALALGLLAVGGLILVAGFAPRRRRH